MAAVSVKDKRKTKNFSSSRLPIYIGPITGWVAIFVFVPLGVVLYFSFLKAGLFGEIINIFTFENYKTAFQIKYAQIFLRSFQLAFEANILCILIGYPLAYWIARYGGRWKARLMSLVIIPSWTCYLIRLYAFKTIVGRTGLLNSFLLSIKLISAPLEILFTPTAVLIGLVYTWLPFMILPLYASLEGLNPRLLEAAEDLGATPFQTFIKVTLPLTKGGLIAGSILVFIPSLGDWLVPHFLGGGKVMMAGSLIAYHFIEVGNIPVGASLAVSLSTIVILALYVMIKLGGKGALERIV